jgi:hypothetical protein
LGLWNHPIPAFGLEAALLLVAMLVYLHSTPQRTAVLAFGLVMLGVQAYVFFGPPPVSPVAAAATALGSYGVFALCIWFLADRTVTRQTA